MDLEPPRPRQDGAEWIRLAGGERVVLSAYPAALRVDFFEAAYVDNVAVCVQLHGADAVPGKSRATISQKSAASAASTQSRSG
jgi:hypothetical protein